MTDTVLVQPHEAGVVRVFLADYQLRMEIGHLGTYDRFCRALGIERIVDHDVQQVMLRALEGMPLVAFFRSAYEVDEKELSAVAEALSALDGTDEMILICRSGAFPDRPVTLQTGGEAKLIATLTEPGADVHFDPLPNPDPVAALGDAPQKKPPSDAAMSGRVAMVALLVMALLVVLMVWIAG